MIAKMTIIKTIQTSRKCSSYNIDWKRAREKTSIVITTDNHNLVSVKRLERNRVK